MKNKVSVENRKKSSRNDISKQNIKLCLWNAQSLKNKLNLVQDYRNEHSLDIMLLTECWLKDDDTAAIGQLENNGEYKFITKPRNNRIGGGIGCLFKPNINIKKLVTSQTKTFEHLALELDTYGRRVTMLIIYRPEPTAANKYSLSDFFSEFTELISAHHCKDHELLIAGDFNFHINKQNHPYAKKLQDIFEMFGLTQHISGPTHAAGNTLDLVVTRANSNLLTLCAIDELLSDHHAILMEINAHKPSAKKERIRFRKTRNLNITKFKEDLKDHLFAINHPPK